MNGEVMKGVGGGDGSENINGGPTLNQWGGGFKDGPHLEEWERTADIRRGVKSNPYPV